MVATALAKAAATTKPAASVKPIAPDKPAAPTKPIAPVKSAAPAKPVASVPAKPAPAAPATESATKIPKRKQALVTDSSQSHKSVSFEQVAVKLQAFETFWNDKFDFLPGLLDKIDLLTLAY